jgi:hypothetical protein
MSYRPLQREEDIGETIALRARRTSAEEDELEDNNWGLDAEVDAEALLETQGIPTEIDLSVACSRHLVILNSSSGRSPFPWSRALQKSYISSAFERLRWESCLEA